LYIVLTSALNKNNIDLSSPSRSKRSRIPVDKGMQWMQAGQSADF
jgi:hypothetical protein